jgi:hypothetical protein
MDGVLDYLLSCYNYRRHFLDLRSPIMSILILKVLVWVTFPTACLAIGFVARDTWTKRHQIIRVLKGKDQ